VENFALAKVLVVQQEEPQTNKNSTVFGRFMSLLQERYATKSIPVLSGAAVLIGWPVEEIVLSGLWIVMQKISEKTGIQLTTQPQVEKVAERTERLLSAGFIIRFGTVEAVAQAFDEQVLQVIERALELGYRPGMKIGAGIWETLQKGNMVPMTMIVRNTVKSTLVAESDLFQLGYLPAAMFFAGMIKTARDYRTKLETQLLAVQQGNKLSGFERFGVEYTNIFELEHLLRKCAAEVDENQDSTAFMGKDSFAKAEEEVQQTLLCQSVFRHFRFNPKNWPDLNRGLSIDSHWVRSQILLAALEEQLEVDFLASVDQYFQAIKAIKVMTDEEIETRVAVRLARQFINKLSVEEQAWLTNLVRESIARLRLYNDKCLDGAESDLVILKMSDSNWLIETNTALAVATGWDKKTPQKVERSGNNLEEWLRNRVVTAICWPELSALEFKEILSARVLSIDLVIDGILAMSHGEAQTEVVAMVMETGRVEAKGIDRLLEAGLIELDIDFIERYCDKLSPATTDRTVDLLFQAIKNRSIKGRDGYRLLWQVFGRTSQAYIQQIVDDVERREAVRDFFLETISSVDEGNDWEGFDRLHQILGDERFYLLRLGVEASQRGADFTSGEFKRGDLSVWEEMFETEGVGYIKLRALGPNVSKTQARQILERLPEETAFRWIHADEPKLDEIWQQVAKARDRLLRPKKRKKK